MNKNVKTLCLIGIFSALCFVSLFLTIPIPSPVGQQMIHFGNAICIIVAIIFGPIVGGLSGAIGMTIYDMLNPIYITSAPKTFILKLGIGLIAGFAFKLLKKKEMPKIKYFILGFAIFFLGIGSTLLIGSVVNKGIALVNPTTLNINENKIDLSEYKKGKYYLEIDGEKYIIQVDESEISSSLESTGKVITTNGTKAKISKNALTFHWASITFPLILGAFLFVVFFLTKKLAYLHLCAIISSIAAVLFNIVGEFIGKYIMQLILGQGQTASIIKAYVSLPATIINACLCVIIIGALFKPLNRAIKNDEE